MIFEFFKGFIADVVLNPTGVLGGDFRCDAQCGQPCSQKLMAVIDPPGHLVSLIGQGNPAFPIHDNIVFFPKQAHRPADTRLGVIQLAGNINGTHQTVPFAEHQNCFEIVFNRFIAFHYAGLLLSNATAAEAGRKSQRQRAPACCKGMFFYFITISCIGQVRHSIQMES